MTKWTTAVTRQVSGLALPLLAALLLALAPPAQLTGRPASSTPPGWTVSVLGVLYRCSARRWRGSVRAACARLTRGAQLVARCCYGGSVK